MHSMADQPQVPDSDRGPWVERYRRVRAESASICAPLETEDYCIQTMPDASPAKWHLAHTSWFFETFLLNAFQPGYQAFHPLYDHLFNSYYLTHGDPFSRPRRGLLARPTVAEVFGYRRAVDLAMVDLIGGVGERDWARVRPLLELGLNHEQQHQELLLTDLKHLFASNPLRPVYLQLPQPPESPEDTADWCGFEGGVRIVGHQGRGFAYDNEGPAHRVWIEDFRLATRPVSNREYLEFVDDGGYTQPGLWLSDGWAVAQAAGWCWPLYWERRDGEWWQMTLAGMRPLDMNAPVCHLSQYEASAFACWAGKRLPTEAEWEVAAAALPVQGNLRESGYLHPAAAAEPPGLRQLFGDVWEWTASAYAPYPGFRTTEGPVGEYNGKFMSGQLVLRGGSCVTPADHLRCTYRNFFYPQDRWQFTGVRLADDATS
jgi:ergothioneine biosynthesis protein EgtB